MSIAAEFGKRVREARARVRLTQDQVAAEVGVTRASIANIEHGRVATNVETVYRLAQTLSVQPGELLGEIAPQSVSDAFAAQVRHETASLYEDALANALRDIRFRLGVDR